MEGVFGHIREVHALNAHNQSRVDENNGLDFV